MFDQYKLKESWAAFDFNEETSGIRSIPLLSVNKRSYYAAMSYPDNAESIMIEVSTDTTIPSSVDSLGFSITCQLLPNKKYVIVVTKSKDASFDIFYAMCIDLIDCVSHSEYSSAIISRLFAWKNFMKTPTNYLSQSSERGLFGELIVLNKLVDVCGAHSKLLDSWLGPIRGLHDFEFPSGSIEVKSTIKSSNCAQITSLDQLDVAAESSLYLALVKLKKCTSSGQTLDDLVENTVARIDSSLKPDFYSKLIFCGYLPNYQISRPFRVQYRSSECYYYHVDQAFPCLTASNVPHQVKSISYQLDLTYQPEVTSAIIEKLVEGL
ncbi:hypothetical protein A6D98_12480 [Aliivibrio fischeri]|uniref:PD-(D/E)XK motif protein n=1 Tax=Aliivibrio fischeri TaxID=668 RepID=UPI00080E8B6B|nr:PD-(D/E)XK motif protein [Aliivibrio fischeri]OCH60192.1 hypothetical protein A6D98_12480 [Aliivibrio fischeri]